MTTWTRDPRARDGVDRDVDDELQFHIDVRTDELAARGVAPGEARRQAVREFGDIDDARRYMRRVGRHTVAVHRRRRLMTGLWQDVKYALRRLHGAPGFAATAMLTIALGIGANTAIFSMVHGILLRPLPYPDPDRLYAVYTANASAGIERGAVSPVDLDDWRAQRKVIADLGGYWYGEGSSGVDLTGRGTPRRLSAVFMTAGFFEALGVHAGLGRLPREDELVRGGHDTVLLLTHGFWLREFGGAPDVIGSTLTVGGEPYDVIGVLPESLQYPTDHADVFVPYATIPDTAIPRIRPVRVLDVVARARPGVSDAEVRSEMQTVTARLAQQYPEDAAWGSATVVPLAEVIVGPARAGLLVLLGAVGLVLLMACVNVAGLQLARAMGRGREMAVRLALGAGRGRLLRQLLTESLILSGLSGAIGLLPAWLGTQALVALSAGQLPRTGEVRLDGTVMAFGVAVTVMAGLLFGIAPALRTSRASGQAALRNSSRSVAGASSQRLRTALVVAEVAVAMVLIVGAGLMVRSFVALLHQSPGFEADHLAAVQFTIDTDRHGSASDRGLPAGSGASYTNYYQAVIEKVRSLPGVVSAAAVKDAPFRGNGEINAFQVPGRAVPPGEDPPLVRAIHISDGYFAAIGARMVDGREFTPRDRGGSPFVVIVNQAFVRQTFPGQRAVGRTLRLGGRVPAEIVGVVNDIRQVAMAQPAEPTLYLDNRQNSRSKTTIVARTAGDPSTMIPALRDAVWSIDPAQPITAEFTFDDAVSRALAGPRLLTVLLGGFGVLGLTLGAVGIYGVLAAIVGERRREIGVRLALGARPGQVLRLVVHRGLVLTLVGVAIGLGGALGLTRYLAAVLYGVGPSDPATLASMAAALVLVSLLASWLPARRAAALDPMETLRAE